MSDPPLRLAYMQHITRVEWLQFYGVLRPPVAYMFNQRLIIDVRQNRLLFNNSLAVFMLISSEQFSTASLKTRSHLYEQG